MNNQEIKEVNKKIVRTTSKIKKLKVLNTIFSLTPGAILVTASTVYTITQCDDKTVPYFYTYLFFGSIGLGLIPISLFSSLDLTRKYKDKLKCLYNTLHEEAIKEDKKLKKKI